MITLAQLRWRAAEKYLQRHLSRPRSSRNRHLLVACMPKSGSTYLTTILGALPEMQILYLVPGYDRREQELDISMLRAANGLNYVAQHHVRCSQPTLTLLRHFSITPIVQVRSIFDIVVSIRDHFRTEGLEASMAYVARGMEQWPDERLDLFIARMMVPWYFNFYVSWLTCDEAIRVRYEELIREPASIVKAICAKASLACTDTDIANAIQQASRSSTRKNKGVAGRGEALSEHTRQVIADMAAFYPGVDFSPMGL